MLLRQGRRERSSRRRHCSCGVGLSPLPPSVAFTCPFGHPLDRRPGRLLAREVGNNGTLAEALALRGPLDPGDPPRADCRGPRRGRAPRLHLLCRGGVGGRRTSSSGRQVQRIDHRRLPAMTTLNQPNASNNNDNSNSENAARDRSAAL